MNDIYENIGKTGYGFFTSFLKEVGEGIKNFFIKNKVGFLPEGMDYSVYQKIKNKIVFKQLRFMIGEHSTLRIILVGLYVSSFDKDTKAKVLEENRQKIYDKYGQRGVSILNMATTGFIESYIKWLSEYNIRKNPSKLELIDLYEKILQEWLETTIFVQGNMPKEIVASKIFGKMNVGFGVFFVFASKSAIKITEEAIREIEIKGPLKNYGYKYSTDILNNNEDERVWIFENIGNQA